MVTPNLWTLRNTSTGLLLDSDVGGHVYTNPDNGGTFQKWVILPLSDNSARVFRNLATGLLLDSNFQGEVYTLAENGGKFQWWEVRVTPTPTILTVVDFATQRVLESNAQRKVYTVMRKADGAFQSWDFQPANA